MDGIYRKIGEIMKRFAVYLLTGALMTGLLTGCGQASVNNSADNVTDTAVSEGTEAKQEKPKEEVKSYTIPKAGVKHIVLSDEGTTVDGSDISTDSGAAVYAANDIVFYLEGQGFTYGEGTEADEHTQAEADAHTVIHITQPGSYALSGSLSAGQIAIDLGEDAEKDPNAVVNLYLNGVDITCSVAPGIIFYNVYECGSDDAEKASATVDTSTAGANVILVDDTTNNVNGSYVARIYKSYTLNEEGTEVVDNKKLHKYDAAFYSKRSMNVTGGNGILNIQAENEGLDSELHLTIDGGNINILSGNDGINTNEDGISVTTINGGTVNIQVTGSTGEGDGIDSNGWLVINGGTVIAAACSTSGDAGIDSDMGIHVNGGTVVASGNMYDRLEDGSQTYAVFTFGDRQKGGTTYTLKNDKEQIVDEWTPANDYIYLVVSSPDLTPGTYTLWCDSIQMASNQGRGGFAGMGGFAGPDGLGGGMPAGNFGEGMKLPEGMEIPEGVERPELPEGVERPELPEGMERPELPEGVERPENGAPQGDDDFEGHGGRGDKGSFGGNQGAGTGELNVEFVIQEGSNFFHNVSIKALES